MAHSYPSTRKVGKKIVPLKTPLAGGGMVTFTFRKKDYKANERDAVRLLSFYKKHMMTWQAVKAWRAKGIVNTTSNGGVYKDRHKTQGWAGSGKVVGYSTGQGPNRISPEWVNRQIRETQASVKAAVSGSKGEYSTNLAIIYKPAPFGTKGSASEFMINVFFDRRGLAFYEKQRRL